MMRLVNDNEIRVKEIQPVDEREDGRDVYPQPWSIEITGRDVPMLDSERSQGRRDLIDQLGPVTEDENPVAFGDGRVANIAEQYRLTGATRGHVERRTFAGLE
jgi:hypothetical protein